MAEIETNLRVIKRSRKKPEPGDVFAMRVSDGSYLFGRVIESEMPRTRAPMPGSNLIYVYRDRSQTPEPVLDDLRPDRLLIPPVFINRKPWTRGYFLTVAHQELTGNDVLPQHCFWDALRKHHVDEQLNVLPQELSPCGVWGLSSYRSLDDKISDALDIPRAPRERQ